MHFNRIVKLVLMISSIIAISGLGGHAFGSFKERQGEHMWLRDSLPYDITGESSKRIKRVMVYGYESRLPNSASFQNIEDLGTSLHSSLLTLATDNAFKPIVFIAHSLGGLVVKQVCELITSVGVIFLHSASSSYHSPIRTTN